MNCPSCGAAAEPGQLRCLFCRRSLETPAKAKSSRPSPHAAVLTYCPSCAKLYPVAAPKCPRCAPARKDLKGGFCPRCAKALATREVHDVTIDECTSCRGTWFDKNEIQRAIDLQIESGEPKRGGATSASALLRDPLHARHDSLACVRCTERMVRRAVVPGGEIVADFCRRHGLWIDHDEVERLRRHVKAGGLEHPDVPVAEFRRKVRGGWRQRHNLAADPPPQPVGFTILDVLWAAFLGLGR
jgi:Zn-finger nucleic acid-binding protein